MYDLYSDIEVGVAVDFKSVEAATAVTGKIIDMQGVRSLVFIQHLGAQDAAVAGTVKIEEASASDMTGAAEVDSDDLEGTFLSIAAANNNKVKRVEYRGKKRYVRITVTPTGATTSKAAQFAFQYVAYKQAGPVAA